MTQIHTLRIKFPHRVIVKAPGLLPMMYTFRELADELDLPPSTLRDWVKRGAPHERDAHMHLWIDGQAFARWINQMCKRTSKKSMGKDEAYCVRCNQAVRPLNPKRRAISGKLGHLTGTCPQCGSQVQRGVRYG